MNWLQFPNSKKNSFRGNYMKKYGSCNLLKNHAPSERISTRCDWSVVWICFLYCIRIEQKPGSWAAVAAFRTYNVRY